MSILDISHGGAGNANLDKWRGASEGQAISYRDIAVRKDGSTFPVEIRLICQIVDGRKLFLGVALDVVERESDGQHAAFLAQRMDERNADLRAAHERLSIATAVGGLGIWDYDIARDHMVCDPQWYRLMGRDPDQPVRQVADMRDMVHPEDRDLVTEVHPTAAKLLAEKRDYGIDFRVIHPDGAVRWIRSVACIVEDSEGAPSRAVGFVVDVTQSRLAEEALERIALEDPLTGLANRRRLDEELAKACQHAMRTGDPLTLAMIDVDHFKLYNDGEGHVRGDAALKALAVILQSVTRRPYDLAARFGGEEFLLLLPGVDQPESILARITEDLGALRIPHPLSPVAPHLTVSSGCVVAFELADVTPLDLLVECDRALYRAKQGGRDRVEISYL